MDYAVDFVLKTMQDLSSSKPVLFQRDGSLYVASSDGFGQVKYGLNTRPIEIRDWEKREQPPEIAESEDIFEGVSGDVRGKLKIRDSEAPYLKAISFGSDDNSFTLEDIAKTAEQLAGLPDDGKIRMVSHDSGYHSHKYGYASDGIDVWIDRARVMNRERYLELLRNAEEGIIQNIKDLDKIEDKQRISGAYEKLLFPDRMIMTPHILVSLPRYGYLHLHREEPDSWTRMTSLEGGILHYSELRIHDESPFGINIKLNAKTQRTISEAKETLKKMDEEVDAVKSNMAIAETFISRINEVHNKICAKDIEWSKSLRKRVREKVIA